MGTCDDGDDHAVIHGNDRTACDCLAWKIAWRRRSWIGCDE